VPHVDVTPTGGLRTFGYQLTGPAVQAVVGLRRDLSPKWSVFGEIKTTYSRHDAEIDGAGRLKTDLTTGAFNLGLNWRF
jgi:lipid A oxidase